MIDTIAFRQELALKQPSPNGQFTLERASGLRAYFKAGRIEWVEVSLPRVLFGTNARLLSSQAEIDAALSKVDKIINQFAVAKSHRIFSRVDLVWHFNKEPQRFFVAHLFCNHPEINKRICVYRNKYQTTGICWDGGAMKIKMYDKTARNIRLPRKIVRVEIELRQRRLRQKLGGGAPVTALNLNACYKAYREIVLPLQSSVQAVPELSEKDRALFYAELLGVPVFPLLARHLSKKTIHRLRQKFSKYSLNYLNLDWEELLPPTKLPIAYEAGKLKPLIPILAASKKPTK